MRKWCLVVALASMLVLLSAQPQVGAGPMAGNGTSANAPATATTAVTASTTTAAVPLQQTCSCGVDCGAGTCTFNCEGNPLACARCIAGCCFAESKRVCGVLP